MLSLSTKIRYSARVLIDIAMQPPGKRVPLHEIAKRQEISRKYLESLMPALKSAGLVVSGKGPSGGYELARPADRITLLDVVSAMEGPVTLVECESRSASCTRKNRCAVSEAWDEISAGINAKLSAVTIASLAARQTEIDGVTTALLYYI